MSVHSVKIKNPMDGEAWWASTTKKLSSVWLFATPWTVAHQAPQSLGFSKTEYWSGLPFPSPGDLPNPGIKPRSPTLQADPLTSEPPWKTYIYIYTHTHTHTYICTHTYIYIHSQFMNHINLPISRFCNLMTYTQRITQCNPEPGSMRQKGLWIIKMFSFIQLLTNIYWAVIRY